MLTLNATDRCDGCSAAAHNVARKGNFELLFCNHHLTKHEDALLTSGWVIESEVSLDDIAPVEVSID